MVEGRTFDDSELEDDLSEASLTRRRKIEHIEICLEEDVQCQRSTMFDYIDFVHNALPEIDKAKIDLNINFFGLRGKYIHKKALKKWLPPEIIQRKKKGFATPMDKWLQTDLADVALRILTSPHAASRQYFNVPAIETMINAHRSRKENYQRQIFALLSFEVWHTTFFEGKSADEYDQYFN